MEAILGNTVPVFIGMTVVLMGFAAFMTGHALAVTWRAAWHTVGYGLLLGCADRFLIFSLFEGELLSIGGFLIDSIVLIAISMFAFQFSRARKMVNQYPWLYERAGIFSWREK